MDSKKLLLIFPIALLIAYFGAAIFYEPKYIFFIKPFIIPSFMVYAILANYKKLNLKFYLFVLFLYIGEIIMLFGYQYIPALRIGLLSYLLCYISLILLASEFVKKNQILSVFKGFTLFVFVLNCIFLVAILYILIISIDDVLTNFIIVLNTISAVVLAIVAVLYLSNDNKSKAFLFFFGACALIINDIFSALESYYLESMVLNTIERLLHFAAFYLIYLSVIQDNYTEKNKRVFI